MAALVAIGNFDGVHLGHRAVLESAEATAARRGLTPKLLTFHPHPATVLGRTAPPLLTRQSRKRELCARVAPSVEFVEVRFDRDFAAQSPEAFAERLAREHDAKVVVVGQNFRFGKARAGDFDALARLGAIYGFEAASEPLRSDADGTLSSTRIRAAIARADLAEAEAMLGRPHMLSGVVEEGKRLGRTLGFPTANLGGVDEMLPPLGIYAVLVDRVAVDGSIRALAKGAMSLGTNPTTDAGDQVKVEVHLFDVSEDLYGSTLRVHVVSRLRDERAFPDLDSLKRHIAADVVEARARLEGRSPDPTTASFA